MAGCEKEKLYFYEETLKIDRKFLHGCHGFALDIGGSLSKVVYVDPTIKDDEDQVTIQMRTFQNKDISRTLQYIKETILIDGCEAGENFRSVTLGIGSLIHKDLINGTLGIKINHTDEFKGFAKGFHFGLTELGPREFTHHNGYAPGKEETYMDYKILEEKAAELKERRERSNSIHDLFPSIICFAGSGVGFLIVNENTDFELVHGSPRGGLYFYALGKMLTKCESFQDLMALANRGVIENVSLCLSDLPSGQYGKINFGEIQEHWTDTMLAFPLSKVVTEGITDPRPEDIARSLLYTFCDDIIKIALDAARRRDIRQIYFAGSFCQGNQMLHDFVEKILYRIDASNKGPSLSAGFVRYESYIGALGALLSACDGSQPQWI